MNGRKLYILSRANQTIITLRILYNTRMGKKEFEKILSNLYYYTYTLLSVVFVVAMIGGLFSGKILAALELGAVGVLISPRTEEYVRIHNPEYPKLANVIILAAGLVLFGLLL